MSALPCIESSYPKTVKFTSLKHFVEHVVSRGCSEHLRRHHGDYSVVLLSGDSGRGCADLLEVGQDDGEADDLEAHDVDVVQCRTPHRAPPPPPPRRRWVPPRSPSSSVGTLHGLVGVGVLGGV